MPRGDLMSGEIMTVTWKYKMKIPNLHAKLSKTIEKHKMSDLKTSSVVV